MFQKVTIEPSVRYWNPGIIPYSRLQITVKAFTYWGASPQVRVTMHSPPSVPTTPTNPRVFVSYSRNPMRQDQVHGSSQNLCDNFFTSYNNIMIDINNCLNGTLYTDLKLTLLPLPGKR
jgi:hypothetical protein